MNKVFAPIPAFHLRPTLLTTSILIALGLGFGTPTLAKSKQANTLQCLGIQTNKFLGNQGTNLCPSPSATAVSSNQSKPIAFGGNPINLLTGNKFEQILDIDDVGDVFVLRLTRYYNSQSTQKGIFGIGWRSDYEMQLQDLGTGIQILGTDGTHYHFDKIEHKDNKTGLLSERFVSNDISLGYVIIKPTNSNGIHSGNTLWQWHLPDGRVFEFSPHKQVSKINSESRYQYGQLSRVQKLSLGKNAPYWQLRYNKDGKLIQVSNHLGQTLRFDYQTQNDGLSYITVTKEQAKSNNTGNNTSNKQVWQYHIDKAGNLSEVITHQGDKLGYEYTDPHDKHNLTAKYRYINHRNHHLNDTQKSSKHKNSDASNNQRNDKDKITNNKILISRFAYDAYDRAILSTGDNDAGKITISYDDKVGYPILGDTYTNTLTNSLGQTTQYHYTYDKTGVRLLSAVGTGCMTCNLSNVRYEYNKQGWVVAELTLDSATHRVIHTKRYVYDAFGRVIQTAIQDEQDKQGSSNITKNSTTNITYTYVSNNTDNPTFYLVKSMTTDSVFDNKRSGVEYTYDDSGNVIKVREFGYDGDGNVLERYLYYTYNLQGLLDTVEIDTNNNIDTNNGSADNVANRNQTKTKLISFVYNKYNQLIQSSEQGLDTKYDYDNQGNLSLVIHPDGQTTHYTYNVYNKPIHIKTGKQFITIDYDDRQRPIYYTDHLGQDIHINYDDVKHSIHYILANGQVVSDVYNTEHEFIERNIKDSQGGVILTDTNHRHDNLDTKNTILEVSTSPITSLIINKALSKLTLATGASYTHHYDDFGRVRLAVDANTGKRHIQYDIMDRPTHINLDGTNQQINYNTLGLPSTFTACTISNNHVDQDCQTTTYHYDTYGKLTKVQHQQTQNDKTQDIQTPSIQYQYTNTGLIDSEVTTLTPNQDYSTQYHYDDKDRIQHVVLPEGISLHYHYNKHSQVTQIDYQTPTSTLWQTLANQWHQLFGKNNGSTLLSNIKADSTRGLLELQHANGSTVSQIYNNHAKLTDKHDHSITTKVGYDNKTGQITSIETNGNLKTIDEITNAYGYDSNGNRIDHTTSNNPSIINQQGKTNPKTHYTYEPNSDRLSVITIKDDQNNIIKTTHYTYDKLGNPVMITTKDSKGHIIKQQSFAYTPNGQIKSIQDIIQDQQGKKTEKLIATYHYNHLRQRIAKTIYHKDDKTSQLKEETIQYLWDKGLISAEIKDGKIVRRYIYLDITPVAVLDYTYQDNKGKVYDKPIKTEVYSVHTDHLGTPKAITNQNKEVVWQIDLDTFGETKQIQAKTTTDPNTGTKKPFEFNLRFAGQYYDSETGYHYNYHRYYNPETGRYLTSDPIGLDGGLNTYGYANGRPYEFVDPLGLATLCDAMYFLADNYQSNPFLNGSRFDKNLVSTEVIPPGGSKQDISVFTDHRNNLTYDVQYVQIAWSLTKTYGPGSPTLAMNGYQIAPLIYAIKDGDWSWFKPSNLSANHRGLQLGEFGAKRFVLFPDFVHDLCPRECRP